MAIIDKIVHNWLPKLVCLALAIILFVFHKVSSIEKKSFSIPLEVIENGIVMQVPQAKKIDRVTVTVRADSEHISTIHSSDIHASINLNNITKFGDVTVPVNLRITEDFLTYDPFEITVKPESVKVKVEKKQIKYIPIEPVLIGEPAFGYDVDQINIDPAHVEVMGPESMIKSTESVVTNPIDISDLSSKFVTQTECKDFNEMLYVLNKGPYTVSVTFKPKQDDKILENINLLVENLKPDLKIEGDLPVFTLTVHGNVPVLEKFNPLENLLSIDCSEIVQSGTYELPLKKNVPSYLELKDELPETISIKVENNPLPEERENEQD